ncbi:hypothetical protein D3C81_1869080 [compost metagenome]
MLVGTGLAGRRAAFKGQVRAEVALGRAVRVGQGSVQGMAPVVFTRQHGNDAAPAPGGPFANLRDGCQAQGQRLGKTQADIGVVKRRQVHVTLHAGLLQGLGACR